MSDLPPQVGATGLAGATDDGTICVPIAREFIEREVIADVMALRDERLLRTLSEEERRRLGDNPVGDIIFLTTADFAKAGSFSQGFWCKGTPGFTKGVTCKVIKSA